MPLFWARHAPSIPLGPPGYGYREMHAPPPYAPRRRYHHRPKARHGAAPENAQAIEAVQQLLMDHGYDLGPGKDGKYGKYTHAALTHFMERMGGTEGLPDSVKEALSDIDPIKAAGSGLTGKKFDNKVFAAVMGAFGKDLPSAFKQFGTLHTKVEKDPDAANEGSFKEAKAPPPLRRGAPAPAPVG